MEFANALRIPHFLSAGSPEGLRRKMLENNIKDGKVYNYFQIVHTGSKWFAWYHKNAELDIKTELAIKADKKTIPGDK